VVAGYVKFKAGFAPAFAAPSPKAPG